jgi:hypothetical protein
LKIWAKHWKYSVVAFVATDAQHRPIYHTNVMLSVGTSMAIICLESIENEKERANVVKSFESTNHTIIDITREQVCHLCANVLEVRGYDQYVGIVWGSYTYTRERESMCKSD